MKEIQPFDFEPPHQPLDSPVVFKLKPLDMQGFYEVQKAIEDGGSAPTWKGIESAARYIQGWSGPIGEFSRSRVRNILNGEADANWAAWLVQVAGALYREALLKDADAKKS